MNKYVVINNLEVDIRNLRILQEKSDLCNSYVNPYDSFHNTIKKFCADLNDRDIPYTHIVLQGKPGIIITSEKHSELLEKILKENIKNEPKNSKESWNKTRCKEFLSDLKKSDVLLNQIPLNLELQPYYGVRNTNNQIELYRTCNWLGIDDITSNYNDVVVVTDFINELHNYYDILNITKTELIYNGLNMKNYDEYFDMFLRSSFFPNDSNTVQDKLLIKIDKNSIQL